MSYLPSRPLISLVALASASLAMFACSGGPGSESELADGSSSTKSRTHGAYVTFTKWDDILQIDAGVEHTEEGCKVLNPLVSDDSTIWSPAQIYWVIKDDADDVTHGTVLKDVFFPGDRVSINEFPGGLGFAYVDTSFANLLPLESIVTATDRSEVRVKLGSPFNAMLRFQGVELAAGGCKSRATYCKSSTNCSVESNFKPFSSVHVKQNFFGYPTSVTYR